MDKTVLFSLSVEDFQSIIVDCVNACLKHHSKGASQNENQLEDLLTCKQVEKLLDIDPSTRVAWTNKGKIKAVGIGSRRYYIRSELMESLELLKK